MINPYSVEGSSPLGSWMGSHTVVMQYPNHPSATRSSEDSYPFSANLRMAPFVGLMQRYLIRGCSIILPQKGTTCRYRVPVLAVVYHALSGQDHGGLHGLVPSVIIRRTCRAEVKSFRIYSVSYSYRLAVVLAFLAHFLSSGATARDRTADLVLTKDVLCQLSYSSK